MVGHFSTPIHSGPSIQGCPAYRHPDRQHAKALALALTRDEHLVEVKHPPNARVFLETRTLIAGFQVEFLGGWVLLGRPQ